MAAARSVHLGVPWKDTSIRPPTLADTGVERPHTVVPTRRSREVVVGEEVDTAQAARKRLIGDD